jgi:hypothetical protein
MRTLICRSSLSMVSMRQVGIELVGCGEGGGEARMVMGLVGMLLCV